VSDVVEPAIDVLRRSTNMLLYLYYETSAESTAMTKSWDTQYTSRETKKHDPSSLLAQVIYILHSTGGCQ